MHIPEMNNISQRTGYFNFLFFRSCTLVLTVAEIHERSLLYAAMKSKHNKIAILVFFNASSAMHSISCNCGQTLYKTEFSLQISNL